MKNFFNASHPFGYDFIAQTSFSSVDKNIAGTLEIKSQIPQNTQENTISQEYSWDFHESSKRYNLYNYRLDILQEKDVPLFSLGLLRTYLRLNTEFFGPQENLQEENDFLLFCALNGRKLIEEQTRRSLIPKYIHLRHRNTRFELPFGPVVYVQKVFYNHHELERNKDYVLLRSGETYILKILHPSLRRDRKIDVYYYTGYGSTPIPPRGNLGDFGDHFLPPKNISPFFGRPRSQNFSTRRYETVPGSKHQQEGQNSISLNLHSNEGNGGVHGDTQDISSLPLNQDINGPDLPENQREVPALNYGQHGSPALHRTKDLYNHGPLEAFMAKEQEPYYHKVPSILQNAVLRAIDSLYYQRGQNWDDFVSLFHEKTLRERQDALQEDLHDEEAQRKARSHGSRENKFSYMI